ncbi:MAG: hypothetical protein RLZZ156_2445 [Deinococcota bacterium]|jgi:hypothetical protein
MTQISSPADLGLWRFGIGQYHQMIRQGILEDRVELLDGWVVEKMPKNPPHSLANALTRAYFEGLGLEFLVRTQEPITLLSSEPEPDVVLVKGMLRDYANRHPSAEEIVLVIEISDSTLERDRVWKQRIYAESNIAMYWIVNLVDKQLEIYSQPKHGQYAEPQIYQLTQVVDFKLEQKVYRVAVQDLMM